VSRDKKKGVAKITSKRPKILLKMSKKDRQAKDKKTRKRGTQNRVQKRKEKKKNTQKTVKQIKINRKHHVKT
jgi:hypothetical protein